MIKTKNICFVGPFRFPWGQAGSRRVYGLAATLSNIGHNVSVISGDVKTHAGIVVTSRGNDIHYKGVEELPLPDDSYYMRFIKTFVRQGDNTIDYLNSLSVLPDIIIVYSGYYPFIGKLLGWARFNKVKLIVDVVEWYDPKQMTAGYFGPFHISAKLALKYSYLKADGLICISSYLFNHYTNNDVKCVVVPPTTEIFSEITEMPNNESCTNFVYAGSPYGKDLIDVIIDAFEVLESLSASVRLTIIGVDLPSLLKLTNRASLPRNVVVIGRLEQENVRSFIESSHYSIIMRRDAVYSKAGFPTKFVESLSLGVPVISNLTSDLSNYLIDGETGFVVKDATVSSLVETLLFSASQDLEQLNVMKRASLSSAKKFFSVDTFQPVIQDFIDSLE